MKDSVPRGHCYHERRKHNLGWFTCSLFEDAGTGGSINRLTSRHWSRRRSQHETSVSCGSHLENAGTVGGIRQVHQQATGQAADLQAHTDTVHHTMTSCTPDRRCTRQGTSGGRHGEQPRHAGGVPHAHRSGRCGCTTASSRSAGRLVAASTSTRSPCAVRSPSLCTVSSDRTSRFCRCMQRCCM